MVTLGVNHDTFCVLHCEQFPTETVVGKKMPTIAFHMVLLTVIHQIFCPIYCKQYHMESCPYERPSGVMSFSGMGSVW